MERNLERQVDTFESAARKVYEINYPTWKNPKHRAQWINTLERYVFPHIGNTSVSQISTPDILNVLTPIWNEKRETARRVKQRMATVFDWAMAKGYVTSNPVAGVIQALPKHGQRPSHMSAMPYAELPRYIQTVRQLGAPESACALEFTILTAARTGETIGATWAEFDLETALWVVPAERMKAGKPHRVPLSARALEIVRERRPLVDNTSAYVFQSPGRGGKPLSNMAMLKFLKSSGSQHTVHGFRSAFRDWCSEQTGFPHAAIEKCLAHEVANKAEAAYARSDLIDRRRELMSAWAKYLESELD